MAFRLVARLLVVVQQLSDRVFFQLPACMDRWWDIRSGGLLDTWWQAKSDKVTGETEAAIQRVESMFSSLSVAEGVFLQNDDGTYEAGVLVQRRIHYLDPEISFLLDGETYTLGDAGTRIYVTETSSVFYVIPVRAASVTKETSVSVTSGTETAVDVGLTMELTDHALVPFSME